MVNMGARNAAYDPFGKDVRNNQAIGLKLFGLRTRKRAQPFVKTACAAFCLEPGKQRCCLKHVINVSARHLPDQVTGSSHTHRQGNQTRSVSCGFQAALDHF